MNNIPTGLSPRVVASPSRIDPSGEVSLSNKAKKTKKTMERSSAVPPPGNYKPEVWTPGIGWPKFWGKLAEPKDLNQKHFSAEK